MAHTKAGCWTWMPGGHAQRPEGRTKTLALKRQINALLAHYGLRIDSLRLVGGKYHYECKTDQADGAHDLAVIARIVNVLCGPKNVEH